MKKIVKRKTKCFIAIGSNIGNRIKNIEVALRYLTLNEDIKIVKISHMLKNPPQEGLKGGYFFNGVIEISTSMIPYELFTFCKEIEIKMGRKKSRLKLPQSRIIDLDILFYGNKIINYKNLKIPHPKIQKRFFVLYPLNEIAPNFIHPKFKKKIKTILRALETEQEK